MRGSYHRHYTDEKNEGTDNLSKLSEATQLVREGAQFQIQEVYFQSQTFNLPGNNYTLSWFFCDSTKLVFAIPENTVLKPSEISLRKKKMFLLAGRDTLVIIMERRGDKELAGKGLSGEEGFYFCHWWIISFLGGWGKADSGELGGTRGGKAEETPS